MKPYENKKYIVFHDAYHYFEHHFNFKASGAISLSDASKPSPLRLKEIRDLITGLTVDCAFIEPQYNRRFVKVVIEGTNAQIGTLDPLGSNLKPGLLLYPNLLRGIAKNLTDCLK